MINRAFLVIPTCLVVIACSPPGDAPATTPAAIAKTPAPSESKQTKTPGAVLVGDRVEGRVVESISAGDFTYVAVEVSAGKKVWVAGPKAEIKVGDAININKGSEMKGFKSKSLKRTFDVIYFVASFGGGAAKTTTHGKGQVPAAPTTSPASGPAGGPATSPASAPTSSPSKTATPTEKVSVAKAEGGHTVAEVFAQAAALAGKEVLVRGRVVKFNSGILGKNWLHLQDGTGDMSAKTHDLTVTSDATVSVGEIVLIKGVLAKDKDFGAGYAYPVIVENATLVTP